MSRLGGVHAAPGHHLSEDALTRAIADELSPVGDFLANRHLGRCSACQVRLDLRARASRTIEEFHQTLIARVEPLSSARRELFIGQLDALLRSAPERSWQERRLERLGVGQFRDSIPALTKALIAACAVAVFFLAWRSQPRSVSADEFLNRATASDQSPLKNTVSGVIRRRFRIKTGSEVIERDTYRDVSGHRRLQTDRATAEGAQLFVQLALAGVSWDDPLSAVSFKNWHDRQQNPHDEIQFSPGGLLSIVAQVRSADIMQESLTVRVDGFHPVGRTIEYRDFGPVEISEVGLEVMSWETVSRLFAEPESTISTAAHGAPIRALLPAATQIDEAELEARLTLSKENADTGEQIEITRDGYGVQVQGLVDNDARKNELLGALRSIPFLSATIRSFDDLKSASARAPSPGVGIVATQPQQPLLARVSPLDHYLVQHGRSRDDLSRISAGLFNDSLAINRSSRSLDQIDLRFSANEELSPTAIRARDELVSRTVTRLLDDLEGQQQLLNDTGMLSDPAGRVSEMTEPGRAAFACLAERNTDLTKELVSGGESGLSENAIATELAETILQLRTAAVHFIRNHGGRGAMSSCPEPLQEP